MGNRIAEQIKDALDVKEVMTYYGVQFNSRGFARCPFHNEKTASLSVKGKYFKCFGCGASGGAIDFAMMYFGLSFNQALVRLNSDFSLALMGEKPTLRDRKNQSDTNRLIKAYNAWLEKKHRHYLMIAGAHAVLYRSVVRGSDMPGLNEYVDKLSDWLDENISIEVRF